MASATYIVENAYAEPVSTTTEEDLDVQRIGHYLDFVKMDSSADLVRGMLVNVIGDRVYVKLYNPYPHRANCVAVMPAIDVTVPILGVKGHYWTDWTLANEVSHNVAYYKCTSTPQ